MSVANFNGDLDYANQTRLRLDEHFYPRVSLEGRFVPLERSKGSIYIQRHVHVDCVVASRSGGSVTVEEKIVRWPGYHYTAMTLETHSNLERTGEQGIGDGWMKTSRADLLLYAFERDDGRLRVWVFYLQRLQDWFAAHYEKYRITDTDNGLYTTRCRIVPLRDIPADLVKIREKIV